MLKNILNLTGVTELEKKEQQAINGGRKQCAPFGVCLEFGLQCGEIECQLGPLDDC